MDAIQKENDELVYQGGLRRSQYEPQKVLQFERGGTGDAVQVLIGSVISDYSMYINN